MVELGKRFRYSVELPAEKLENRSPIPGKRAEFSLFQIVSGTYPAILSSGGFSAVVKPPGLADNYSSPSGIEINSLTPNNTYRGRTAPLTSKRCILYIYSTNIGTEYFKHGIYSPFFFKIQFVQ